MLPLASASWFRRAALMKRWRRAAMSCPAYSLTWAPAGAAAARFCRIQSFKPPGAQQWRLTTLATAANCAPTTTPAWPGNLGVQQWSWGQPVMPSYHSLPYLSVRSCCYGHLTCLCALPATPCRTHDSATGTCYLMGADHQRVQAPQIQHMWSGTFRDPIDLATCPTAVQHDVDLLLQGRVAILRNGPGACCAACTQTNCTAW